MHVRITVVIAMFLVLSATIFAQGKKPYALLPVSSAQNVSRLCSREGISNTGGWYRNAGQIGLLEFRLVMFRDCGWMARQEMVRFFTPMPTTASTSLS